MRKSAKILALFAVVLTAQFGFAAERVTLRNGFEMTCDHKAVDGDHVRLYLKSGSEDFVEMRADEIASVEAVPDAPVAKPVMAVAVPAQSEKLDKSDLHEILSQAGAAHNLDADLLASVVKAESGGNQYAVSRTGARGLMQLMPKTAAQLGVNDSFAADQNVRGGTAYLDALLVKYKDNLALALAAYNAGPAAVERYHGIPPYRETRAYVARVIHEFNRRVEARRLAAHSVATVTP